MFQLALTEVQRQVLENQQRIIDQQNEILAQDDFWTQLSEHLVMSFAFYCLGAIMFAWFIVRFLRNRMRFDHDLDKGTIMRVIDVDIKTKKKRKWLIVNPSNLWQFIDIILLSFFDRGTDKYIEMQDTKRIRIIRKILVIFIIMLVWSGVSLIASASKVNMDVLHYLRIFLFE